MWLYSPVCVGPCRKPRRQVFSQRGSFYFSETTVPPPCGQAIDCSAKANGRYPDLDQNCGTWYTCEDKKFFGHNYCPSGTYFPRYMIECANNKCADQHVHPRCLISTFAVRRFNSMTQEHVVSIFEKSTFYFVPVAVYLVNMAHFYCH